jgi:broad specificity phosphatase PhoE
MKLLLIRHGHTEWNELGKAQGRIDIPLSKTGHEQAKALADSLQKERPQAVYTSPLKRAADTAQYVGAASKACVIVEDALTEIQFGEWEGLSFEQIGKTYQEIYSVWRDTPFDCAVPKAESLREVLDRCVDLLDVLHKRHNEGTVAVISHTLPIKMMIAYLIGLPFNRIHALRLDNTGRTELIMKPDGRNILTVMNDTSHLNGACLKWQTLR